MSHAITATVLTFAGYWLGLFIGVPFNMEDSLGILFAVVIMGAYNIVLTEKKNKKN